MKALAQRDSTSLYTFSRLSKHNARLNNTLCLYLTLYTQKELKSKLLCKFDHLKSPCKALSQLNESNIETVLNADNLTAYKTVYDNYLYAKNHQQHQDDLKLIMHGRIVQTKAEKNISNYRIYTALKLNPGNANAFLKHADLKKVSLDTTREMLKFVNEYKAV